MESVQTVVVGAGVVGLAVARTLALSGREVVILEAEDAIGSQTSSRNSEVIHAGIYYPKGSLKAQTCVHGRRMLYAYCDAHGVPYRRCGKLIVASDDSQRTALASLLAHALANGVEDIAEISRAEALEMEPALRCVAALHSASTGIVDSHALMLSYLGDAQARGAALALRSPLLAVAAAADHFELEVGGEHPMRLATTEIVNCAGLGAQALAARMLGYRGAPRGWYAKGNYYSLAARPPFSRLIYPIPEPGGLGIHLTLDLAGQARFGPDVEWVDQIDYRVDPARAAGFYGSIRRYWPDLPDGALMPGYAGIRPKLSGPGGPAADFMIEGPEAHGIPGLVQLYGIESPGLTASLSLADEVLRHLGA